MFLVGFALTLGFGLLLQHFGLPERSIRLVILALVLAVPVFLALAARTMELSSYFAYRRALGAERGAAVLCALLLGADLPLILAAPGSDEIITILFGNWLAIFFIGMVSGYGMRRSGAFSLRQWLLERFPEKGVQFMVSLTLIVSGAALCLTGLETATRLLGSAFDLPRTSALVMTSGFVLVPLILGGLLASLLIGTFALVLALAAFLVPFLVQGFFLPALPSLDGRWSGICQEALLLGLGLGVTPALLGPAIAAINRRTVRKIGFDTFAWSLIVLLVIAWPLREQISTLFGLTGANLAGADIAATNASRKLVGGYLSQFSGPQVAIESLMSIAVYVLALALTLAAFQALASTISEGFTTNRKPFKTLSSQRLARNRLILGILVVCAALGLTRISFDTKTMLELALAVNAGGLVPLVVLALWRRARSDAALISFYVVIGTVGAVLISDKLVPMRAHLITAILGSIAGAIVVGGLVAWGGNRASGAIDARSLHDEPDELEEAR